jgi:hypothetical protein
MAAFHYPSQMNEDSDWCNEKNARTVGYDAVAVKPAIKPN